MPFSSSRAAVDDLGCVVAALEVASLAGAAVGAESLDGTGVGPETQPPAMIATIPTTSPGPPRAMGTPPRSADVDHLVIAPTASERARFPQLSPWRKTDP